MPTTTFVAVSEGYLNHILVVVPTPRYRDNMVQWAILLFELCILLKSAVFIRKTI